MNRNSKNLITAPVLARMCECDLKTVHNWVANGYIEHFRTFGGHLRFVKSKVVSFMKERGYPVPDEFLEEEIKTEETKPIKKKKKIKKKK